MDDYEKLGVFYLGKEYQFDQSRLTDDLVLYDSKDLTTHAVCLGMTGSGKTGLCLSLLEEAAIDGIPAIIIDPKGDLGNLLLTFPDLKPADFLPWIDAGEAARRGQTPEKYSQTVAKRWKKGLHDWGQPPERIARFREAVDLAVYTPGSTAGIPLTVLKSFAAPPDAIRNDGDAFRERVSAATSGLLALVGITADPVRSREHILISTILSNAWQQGRNLDVPKLIGEIQSPKFDKVGIFDLESFYPAKDRMELAMSLNNLMASPTFAGWMEGEPLDVQSLLMTPQGKPRFSILSIAHLSETERMFFVTILLNEVLAWIRTQPGTSSLRAILYMDEIFGYFPPTKNPPSKPPMLTLLKQARAYGLGLVLATQNPVDLDYKGLSNTGTWFLGRLQTERDKLRVLDGLEGATAAAGIRFDRQEIEAILSGLETRQFLMNNVHEDQPVVFQTRWAMSYLRGPLTRQQISQLMADRKNEATSTETPKAISQPTEQVSTETATLQHDPPAAPAGVGVEYWIPDVPPTAEASVVYRPALLASCRLHYVRASYKVDRWETRSYLRSISSGKVPKTIWSEAIRLRPESVETMSVPDEGIAFSELPADLTNAKNYKAWQDSLAGHLYRNESLTVFKCQELSKYSNPAETEAEFRVRLRHDAREHRDLEIEKIRNKYATKIASIQKQIRTAEAGVDREASQANRAYFDSAISFGSAILGAMFGRKTMSRSNVSKASTSLRSAGRAAQQRGDVARAQEKVEQLNEDLKTLEQQLEVDVKELESEFEIDNLEFEPLTVRARKSDIEVAPLRLVWVPWRVDSSGIAEPLVEFEVVETAS